MNTINNIYIAGLPRSGSTLLGMMLNQHNKVFHAGESWYWGKLDPKDTMCTCGKINCEILRKIADNINSFEEILSIGSIINKLDAILENKKEVNLLENENKIEIVIKGLEALFNLYRIEVAKDIIVDKSTNIYLGEKLFFKDNWKVIFLLRDPRGIIYSNKKSSIRHNNEFSMLDKIEAMRKFTGIVSNLILNNKDLLLVKYEDLCFNSESTLKRICNYLNIEYNKGMLNYRKDRGHVLMANRNRLGNNIDIIEDLGWKDGLNNDENKIILQQNDIVSFYSSLGYKF